MRIQCWTLPVLIGCCSLELAAAVKQKTDHHLYVAVTSSDVQQLQASHLEKSDLLNVSDAQGTSKNSEGTEIDGPRPKKPKKSAPVPIKEIEALPQYKKANAAELWARPFGMIAAREDKLSWSGFYTRLQQLLGFDQEQRLQAISRDGMRMFDLMQFAIHAFADALSEDERESVRSWKETSQGTLPVIDSKSFEGLGLTLAGFEKIAEQIQQAKF